MFGKRMESMGQMKERFLVDLRRQGRQMRWEQGRRRGGRREEKRREQEEQEEVLGGGLEEDGGRGEEDEGGGKEAKYAELWYEDEGLFII